MVQTSFTVADEAGLTTALQGISSGGTNAAIGTAYTITATAAILANSETVNLLSGSSLTLLGGFPFIVNAFTITGSVIADLNLTGTVTLNNGTFVNDVTSVTNGTIVAGLFTGAIYGATSDGGDTVINDGTIAGGPSYAIDLSSGTVQNGWDGKQSALITGVLGGVALLGNGLLQNGGTIATTGTSSAAVFLGSGTVDNGQLGDTTATISGGYNGVEITGAGVVNNDGTIANLFSDAVYLGSGMVTNGQVGDTSAWIDGGSGNGVSIASGVGTVANYGTITGMGVSGVYLALGGTVTNGAPFDTTALVTGSTIGVFVAGQGALLNFGTVSATGGAGSAITGAVFTTGGTIENLGLAATISGDDWGASVNGGKAFVLNLGTIEATSQSAPGIGLDLNAGGSAINGTSTGSGATLNGSYDGVRISAGAAGAGASVVNNGTISGLTGVDFHSGPTAATGTLTNNGLIESTSGPSGNAVVFGTGTERLVLQAGGAFVGQVVGGSAGSTTMELAGGTNGTLSALGNDAGSVSDSAGGFGFTGFETIVVDSGATWVIAAPGTLDTLNNAGALSLSGGSATVSGPLTNSGILAIAGNTLVAASGLVGDSGLLAISGGGVLQANGSGVSVSGIFGTTGALTVAGVGSKLLDTGALNVGQGGDGSVLIQNQATAIIGGNTANALAGLDIGQTGIAPGNGTVPGSGAATVNDALLSNTGRFIVGDAGLGSLSVTAAGTVTTSANAVIASAAGSDGSSVSVTGQGSSLRVAGSLTVGAAAAGALSINAGATVTAASLDAGRSANSSGVITLTGSHTALTTTGTLTIGGGGIGEMSVLNGATLITGSDLNVGETAGGAGNIDIEGTSTLIVGGDLNFGAGGPAEITVGPNATFALDNGVLNGTPGNATLTLFTTIDPIASNSVTQNIKNSGTQDYTQHVDSSPFNLAPGISYTLNTPTISGKATFSIGDSGTTLVLNADTVSAGTTIAFTDGTGKLVIGMDVLETISVPNGKKFTSVANPHLGDLLIGGFSGLIGGFAAGDQIVVETDGAATFSQTGSVVSVIENGATVGALRFDSLDAATAAATDGLIDQVLCFLPDTLIATPRGEVKVQALKVGDLVRTAAGVDRAVVWIGEGRVLAPRGRRTAATPVIVRHGALAPNVPHYDLHVTKGHALFIDDVLIPVEFLVNHRSILWDDQAREVSLYHVELETHDVLLANGAPAESYRDDGNRWLFRNANSGWDLPEKPPCAPVLTGGPVVDAVWQRLLERSGPRPGLPLTDDPDLHLLVDGVRVDGARAGDRCVFRLRAGADEVRLVSRAAAPAELGLARDPRVLGVAVRRIELWQGPRVTVLAADDARLVDGFHAYEAEDGIRWTDGDAGLPVDRLTGDAELVVLLGGTTRYVDTDGALRSVA